MFAPPVAKPKSAPPQRSAVAAKRPDQAAVGPWQMLQQGIGNQAMQAMLGRRGNAPKAVPGAMAPLALSLQGLVGNQAIKSALENKIPLGIGSSVIRDLQPWTHPKGLRHMQALPWLKPEDLQGAIPLQLPPELDLGTLRPPANKNNDFIVASDEFGVTIVHPASETRIRVVEEEHRYKPEEWTYETVKHPKGTPAICYQLIAPEEDKPGEVLIAVGPGAFVEVEEPAPFEGAKEWQLENWQPHMGGNFDVTIVEMPDNTLVPLPNEDIDVQMLLKAGGKMHYPDKHTWQGAISYQDYVMTIGMLIADFLFAAIPLAAELAEAVTLASEAAAVAAELEETAALGGLKAGVSPSTGAALEDVAASPITSEIADEEGLIAEANPLAAEPEPSVGQTPGETAPAGGRGLLDVRASTEPRARLDQHLENMIEHDIEPGDLGYNAQEWEQFQSDYTLNPQKALADLEGRFDRLGVRASKAPAIEGESVGRIPQVPKAPLDLPEYQESIESARRAMTNLPAAPGVKTTAGVEGGLPVRSGYKPTKQFPEAAEATERAMVEGHEAGAAPDPHEFDRTAAAGDSGQVRGSHAEMQAAVLSPDNPVGVSKPMCPDCRFWFRARAIERGVPQFVADPEGTRVFMPDGAVHIQRYPEGMLGPRGNR